MVRIASEAGRRKRAETEKSREPPHRRDIITFRDRRDSRRGISDGEITIMVPPKARRLRAGRVIVSSCAARYGHMGLHRDEAPASARARMTREGGRQEIPSITLLLPAPRFIFHSENVLRKLFRNVTSLPTPLPLAPTPLIASHPSAALFSRVCLFSL